jgi:hypothetical protein
LSLAESDNLLLEEAACFKFSALVYGSDFVVEARALGGDLFLGLMLEKALTPEYSLDASSNS